MSGRGKVLRRFPYEERAARARNENAALMQAADLRRLTPSGRWDKKHPSWSTWETLAAAFWKAIEDVVPGFHEDAERLKRGDTTRVDAIIDFLEADPLFFRSGYLKADLVRWLGRVTLSDGQLARLRDVVLKVVRTGWRREFRRYCALSRRLDSDEFKAALGNLAQSSREDIRQRAARVLAALDGQPWRPWSK